MTYPEDLSLVELAEYYAKYQDDKCLEELARRDKYERMGQSFEEQPDNQTVFDFHKEDLVSSSMSANNASVEDPYFATGAKDILRQRTAEVKQMSGAWEEAYESGFRAGTKHGLKAAQEITNIPGVANEDKKNEES